MTAVPLSLDDRALLLELASRRAFPDTLQVTAEQRKLVTLRELELDLEPILASPVVRGWRVGEEAFWVVMFDQEETLTGDLQAVVVGHAGDPSAFPALLEATRAEARSRDNLAVVTSVYPQLGPEPFDALGFTPELVRVATVPQVRPHPSGFSLRRATPADLMFLGYLNCASLDAYVPAGREARAAQVAFRNMQSYMGLDLRPESSRVGLILHQGNDDLGYVLLDLTMRAELTGSPAAYFYDIAVNPDHYRKGAAKALMDECQNWLVDNGWKLLIGDISVNNKLALHGAIDIVGCRVESTRWGRWVDGPPPE